MMRSMIACVSAAGVLAACGGAAWTGASPQELVGCYDVRATTEAADELPGFRLFLEDAPGAGPDAYRAATILPNGRQGVYPFDRWSLSEGQLVVRSSGQSGAILRLSPSSESLAGTMSYYSDVAGTVIPDVEVESRPVSCG